MEKCNNRIVTLSGDPASGKGTVAKKLKMLYEAKGLKVHIISVGDIFRKVAIREYKKKFPEIENPTIEEINSNPNFAGELKRIDENIDNEIAKLAEEINSQERPGEVFIFDARRAFLKIEGSFDVRLMVDRKTAGERVFNDKKRGKEDQYSSLEEATEDTASRRDSEIQRCMQQYGVNLTDHKYFNLVICTTLASVDDIAQTIQICEELERQGKPYAKNWASPELFYPTQSIGETWSISPWTSGLTPEELAELIKKNGIFPDKPVYSKTITDSPYQFVSDGHHRVFASIMAGKTLIPYEARGNVDKATVSSIRKLSEIYDHEDSTHKPDGTAFRYATYPEIDERSAEHDMCY